MTKKFITIITAFIITANVFLFPIMASANTEKLYNKRLKAILPFPTGKCPIPNDTCFAPLTFQKFEDDLENLKNKPSNINSIEFGIKSLGYCNSDQTVPCNYTICDVIQIFINITKLILQTIGGVVLLFLAYSSFLFVTAQGSAEKITQGRKVMRYAITGLIIVFLAYQLVGFVILAILNQGNITSSTKPKENTVRGINFDAWDSLSKLRGDCSPEDNNNNNNNNKN